MDDPPNNGFCSAGFAPAFPNRVPPPVFDEAAGVVVLLLVFPKANPAPPVLLGCPPNRPGDDEEGVVDVPNIPPAEGALLVAFFDGPEELAPKVKDIIASVCRGSECARVVFVSLECDDADNRRWRL